MDPLPIAKVRYNDAMASPHTARLADAVAELVVASLQGPPHAVEEALAGVEHRVTEIEPRRGVPLATVAAVFQRDCWTCRYCAGKTIAPPVLRVLSHLYPDRFPYHPNWKAGLVHPAYLLLSTSLDHVHPGGRGGSWSDGANLVTACWPCNSGKGDFTLEEIDWELLTEEEVRSEWTGLTADYPALWRAAGDPDAAYHRRWLRALSLS
jgi:5-methylcytosine-specific restriction endonuclease McrA